MLPCFFLHCSSSCILEKPRSQRLQDIGKQPFEIRNQQPYALQQSRRLTAGIRQKRFGAVIIDQKPRERRKGVDRCLCLFVQQCRNQCFVVRQSVSGIAQKPCLFGKQTG